MSKEVAVVTGAGSGIGAEIARTLSSRGFAVVVTDINLESAKAVSGGLNDSIALQLDVTDIDSIQKVADQVVNQFKRLDVWVSNAGISKMQRFEEISKNDLIKTFEVNTFGVFYSGQVAAKMMIKLGKGGVIINTASMAAKQGRVPFLADYVASKFAVMGLTQAMAFELAKHKIRVNAVCPGFVATPMQERELKWEADLRGTDPATVKQMWINDTPLGRLQTPLDVAKVVAFLASPDAEFMTGESISINGGAYMD